MQPKYLEVIWRHLSIDLVRFDRLNAAGKLCAMCCLNDLQGTLGLSASPKHISHTFGAVSSIQMIPSVQLRDYVLEAVTCARSSS